MLIGIVGKTPEGWGTTKLRASFEKHGISSMFFKFSDLAARVGYHSAVDMNYEDRVRGLSAVIVRPVGRGSLEEIIFRMDFLHNLERKGVFVVNSAKTIERCVDKYYALTFLERSGIPIPRTFVTESLEEALKGFQELGGDVVLKPLFGSRGVGSTRIFDADIAARIFRSVKLYRGVFYLQEFVHHGNSDIRAFVVNNRVVAAMRRVGNSWKTNVSQGARPIAIQLSEKLQFLAVKAAKVVGCKVAGIDILESEKGPLIVELNSQPGWHGLQSVTQVNVADCIVDYVLDEVKK